MIPEDPNEGQTYLSRDVLTLLIVLGLVGVGELAWWLLEWLAG
ncbi:MAG: hypothetical protein ACLQNE_30135 [Thermoguttaceae bacterium]